jgi:hypothetical protein
MSDLSAVSMADPTKTHPRRHVLGLDLGQSQDFSALAVLEDVDCWFAETGTWSRFYAIRHLRRWPLRTKYPTVVADVAELLRGPQLVDPLLVIDSTGVGRAVCDLFDAEDLGAPIRRVSITAGHRAHQDEDGTWMVPKRELVSTLQVLLQTQRLTIARLSDRETLVKELLAFKVKISIALNELYGAWREGTHDDLVLAVALACWRAGPISDDDAAEELPPSDPRLRPEFWRGL